MHSKITRSSAIKFVILMGLVSLFADMTYEGARSITGQYLAILGASGAIVGIVAGFGELIGYSFRLVTGYISDKTGKYWFMTILGYTLNLVAVPLLALANNWPMAASLIILERFGKAIRNPAGNAMLSYATHTVGRGWGFGLHEAMDQLGAMFGPLIMSAVLYYKGSYQDGFALLFIPAICAFIILIIARITYPRPEDLEISNPEINSTGLSKQYWLYIVAICCIAMGYVHFALMAYHFKKTAEFSEVWFPIFFAIAMAADGISALILGHLYDRKGIITLMFVTIISVFYVPLVFLYGFYSILAGVILWGIGLGAQESIMRAMVANLVVKERRGTAYGIFTIWFGIFWFLGSTCMGFLYDIWIPGLIIFAIFFQLLSIPFIYAVAKYEGVKGS